MMGASSQSSPTLSALVEKQVLSKPMAGFLTLAVEKGLNILVSGAAGAGKTTLLNALCHAMHIEDSLMLIEERAEIRLPNAKLIAFVLPRGEDGSVDESVRGQYLNNAMRMLSSLSWVIVGDIAVGDACKLANLWALPGCGMTTIHAPTVDAAYARFNALVKQGEPHATDAWLQHLVYFIVHVERGADGAYRVTHVAQPVRQVDGSIAMQDIFAYHGVFTYTGVAVSDCFSDWPIAEMNALLSTQH